MKKIQRSIGFEQNFCCSWFMRRKSPEGYTPTAQKRVIQQTTNGNLADLRVLSLPFSVILRVQKNDGSNVNGC